MELRSQRSRYPLRFITGFCTVRSSLRVRCVTMISWGASILVALLAAAIGLVLGGFIASNAVSWYRISSFEGGAGYFVVGMALLGFVAGFLIGLVATRVVAAS